ncbi:hypothetical protein JAAARDRAFT_538928 [Jaapia argillacea MUCL 33604]|uniref:Uncharacterized protein n=1 Tax=Jaapia argillacea MUCL 33604 TaxID=933084 RepID=A0A067P8Q1_9AGAM|nr:hypothetical protein JAAARDRAFT_538928 [Jaapia argillacea MUCL 33604]
MRLVSPNSHLPPIGLLNLIFTDLPTSVPVGLSDGSLSCFIEDPCHSLHVVRDHQLGTGFDSNPIDIQIMRPVVLGFIIGVLVAPLLVFQE